MRLRYIEVFRAVLLTGSASAAALYLHVSQPVVSRTLQYAEQSLGFKLFLRKSGRLVPTPEAIELYPAIERVFLEIEKFDQLSSNIRRRDLGCLRIAVTPSLAQSVLPTTISRVLRALPESQFELTTLHSNEIVAALRTHSADVGMGAASPAAAGIDDVTVASGRMVLAVPASWPLLKLQVATDLDRRPMIKLHDRTPLGSLISEYLGNVGLGKRENITVEAYSIAMALASSGVGYAIIDEFTAMQSHPDELRIYALEPKFEFDVKLRTCAGQGKSALVTALIAELGPAAQELSRQCKKRCEARSIQLII